MRFVQTVPMAHLVCKISHSASLLTLGRNWHRYAKPYYRQTVMMQAHELSMSPLDRGPTLQGTGADVCIDF